MNLVAEFFGLCSLIVYCYSLQFDDRDKLLKALIISNFLSALQYLMLNAYTALFTCLIASFRSLVFAKYNKVDKDAPLWVLMIFIGIIIYSGVISYTNLFSLVPIITTILYSICVWQKNLKLFRFYCFINAFIWIFYNYLLGAHVASISSIIEIISVTISIIRIDILKIQTKKDN